MVSPGGRDLSAGEALEYRVAIALAKMEQLGEFVREPRALVELPNLRPIPVWAWASAIGVTVMIGMGQVGMGLLLLVLFWKL